eukprot:4867807-Amphidinium_carterae.1
MLCTALTSYRLPHSPAKHEELRSRPPPRRNRGLGPNTNADVCLLLVLLLFLLGKKSKDCKYTPLGLGFLTHYRDCDIVQRMQDNMARK